MKTYLYLPLLLLALLLPNDSQGQGGAINTVTNVAQLLTRSPSMQNPNVNVLGYYTAADWGGGRRFVTTTNPPTTVTNQAHVFQSIVNPAMYYVSEDRLSPKQDFRWWGPTTNGAGTAHIALKAAADWMTNGGTILLAPQRFKFGALVIITNNVSLEGADRDATVLDFTDAAIATNAPCIRYQGRSLATNIVVADLPAGTNKVVLSAPPPAMAVGEVFILHNDNDWSYMAGRSYYHAGQFGTVRSISGNEVLMQESIIENLSATTAPTPNSLHFVKLAPLTAKVSGLTLIAEKTSIGLEFQVSKDCVVEDVKAWGTDYTHVYFNVAYNPHVSRVFVDYDTDPIRGLGYGVTFGAAEYADVSHCFLRTSRHGLDAGSSSFGLGVPNSFMRFRDSTVSSTKDGFQFGAAFHENNRYGSYRNCDLPQGIAIGGNHNEIVGCRIVNPAGLQAISMASTGANKGADFRIEDNDITYRNGTVPEGATLVRINWSPQAVTTSGSPVGIDTNYWAGSDGDKEGEWLRINNNKFRFVDPIERSIYGVFIDESSTLNDTNRFRKATFGGIEFRGNVFSYSSNQVFQLLTAGGNSQDVVGLFMQTRSNMVWNSWIVEDNDFGALGIRTVGSAKDFRISNNRFRNSLHKVGAIYITPNYFAYDNVGDIQIRGNTIRNTSGSGMIVQDTLGTVTVSDNVIEDWSSFVGGGYGIYLSYSSANQAWSTNSLKQAILERNTYLSDRSATVTTSALVQNPGAEVHRRDEVFKGFAQDTPAVVSLGLPDITSYRTNNTRTTLPFRPGALTSAQQIQNFTADDGSLAWDSTGSNLIQSVRGIWTVVGAGAGGGMVPVDTIAALKGISPSAANVNVLVLGYYNKGDWGSPRIFSATTSPPGATNLGNIFPNINQPSVYYVAWDRLASEQDVRWWGAIPDDALYDGIGLQAAIFSGAKVVSLPAGGFNLRDGDTIYGGLVITNTMTLKGAHRDSTILNYIGTTNTLTIGPTNWIAGVTPVIQSVEVRDIFFYGAWSTNVSVQSHIKVRGATHGKIEDCKFSNAPIGNAIYLEEGAWIWDITRCSIGFANVGIRMLATGAVGSIISATHITGGEIAGCHWGILTGTTNAPPAIYQNTRLHANIWITDTTIEGNGTNYVTGGKPGGGIWLNAAESVNIDGIYTELNPVDIRLGSLAATNALSCMNINISQVRFADSTNGVQFYSATGVSLDNNWFVQSRSTNIVVATSNVARSTVGTGNVSSAQTNNCPTIHDPNNLLIVETPCGSGDGGTGGGSGTVVRTIADLRNVIPSPATSNVLVMGYYTPGDWGPGRRFAASTAYTIANTNLGNLFQNVNQSSVFYVSEDRNSMNQDARWFGVQPGPPNCSVQLQAAADYCKTFDIYGINYGKTLVLNGDPAYYVLTNGVGLECSFDLSRAYFVTAITNIGGTNALPAFTVGNTNLGVSPPNYAYSGLVCKLPHGIESTMPPYQVGVGIQFQGITKSEIHLGSVSRFKTGMRFLGTRAESHYNNFHGGLLTANRNGFAYESDSGGGAANANNFYGLSINQAFISTNDVTTLTNGYEAIIINGEPGVGSINGNQFFGTSLEGFGSSRFISLTNVSGIKFVGTRIESHSELFPHLTNNLETPYIQVTATRTGVGWNNSFDFTQVVGITGGRGPWIMETSIPDGGLWPGGNRISTPEVQLTRINNTGIVPAGFGQVYEHSRFADQPAITFYTPPMGPSNAVTFPELYTLAISDTYIKGKPKFWTNNPAWKQATSDGRFQYFDIANVLNGQHYVTAGQFTFDNGSTTMNRAATYRVNNWQIAGAGGSHVLGQFQVIVNNTASQYRELTMGIWPDNNTDTSIQAMRGWSGISSGGPYGTSTGMQGLKLMTGNSDEQVQMQVGFASQPHFALTGSQATFAGVNVATTRDLNASNLISQSLTLRPDATTNTAKIADTTTQLFGYQIANNSPLSWQLQNANAGNAATAALNLSTVGANGSLGVFPTTYSSPNYNGRTRLYNSTNGMVFSMIGTANPDLRIEFASTIALNLWSNLFDIQVGSTKLRAPQGTPGFVLGVTNDAASASQYLVTIPIGSLGGGGGLGDVVGPAFATDNALAIYNSTTGKIIKNSGVTVDQATNLVVPGNASGLDASVTNHFVTYRQLTATVNGGIATFFNASSATNFQPSGTVLSTNWMSQILPPQTTNSAVALADGSFVAVFVSTNTFTFFPEATATVTLFCYENSAGTGSVRPEIAIINAVTKVEEFVMPNPPGYQVVPNSTGPTTPLNFPVPIRQYVSTTNFHVAVKIRLSESGTDPIIRIVTGGSYPSYASLPVSGDIFLPEAPNDGNPYGRQSQSWTNLHAVYGQLSKSNLWTGTSNLFTGRVVVRSELNASNLIGNSLGLGDPWTIGQTVTASAMNPIYAYQSSVNGGYTWTLQNANAVGTASYSRLNLGTPTAGGSMYVYPTAFATAALAGRTVFDNSARGVKMIANSGDFRIDAGGDVDNLIVTNGQTTVRNNLSTSNILVRTISLSPTMLTTTAPFASPTTPIYATTDSGNVAVQYLFQNANSGVSAINRVVSSAFGVAGYLATYPDGYTSNPRLAFRTTVENNKNGVTILPYIGDFRVNFDSATVDSLILTNNLLTINADTTKLRAGLSNITHLAGFGASPATAAQPIVTVAGANGDLLYYNGGWSSRTIGTNGQVLTVTNGTPSWMTPAAGSGGGGSTYSQMAQVVGKAEFIIQHTGGGSPSSSIGNVTTNGIVSAVLIVGGSGGTTPAEVQLTFASNIGTNYVVLVDVMDTVVSGNGPTIGGEMAPTGGGTYHLTGSCRLWFRGPDGSVPNGGEYVRAWVMQYVDVTSGGGAGGVASDPPNDAIPYMRQHTNWVNGHTVIANDLIAAPVLGDPQVQGLDDLSTILSSFFDQLTIPIVLGDPSVDPLPLDSITAPSLRTYFDGRYGRLTSPNTWTLAQTFNTQMQIAGGAIVSVGSTFATPATTNTFTHFAGWPFTPVSNSPVLSSMTPANVANTLKPSLDALYAPIGSGGSVRVNYTDTVTNFTGSADIVWGASAGSGTASIVPSVALAGNPTAPTPDPRDNDSSIATTAFVTQSEGATSGYRLWDDLFNQTTLAGDKGSTGVNGSGVIGVVVSEAGKPGLRRIRTSALNQTSGWGWIGPGTAALLLGPAQSSETAYFETSLKLSALSTATDAHSLRVGFWSGLGSTNVPSDGAYLLHQSNLSAGNNWVLQTINNSTASTPVDTGQPVNVNTWVKLAVLLTSTNAVAYINSTAVATNSSQIPVGRSMNIGIHTPRIAGTANVDVILDWVAVDWRGIR